MKAFIMAAGRGERLGELTKDFPKCLLPIGGVPMLERWIRKLASWGFSDVLINTSYKAPEILTFLKYREMGEPWGIGVYVTKENTPMGTARTLWMGKNAVKNDASFAVIYCDVWTDFDLRNMIESHSRTVTIGLNYVSHPVQKGVALTCGDSVIDFCEKPENPAEGLPIWSGILIANSNVFDLMDGTETDIGMDLLPKLAKGGQVGFYHIKDTLFDIGESVDKYNEVKDYGSK